MKKFLKVATILCTAVLAVNLAACSNGSTLLGKPQIPQPLSYAERREAAFDDLKASAELFASEFSAAAYRDYNGAENFAVSPVSVYMALALAAECTAGSTREELLSALNVTYPVMESQFSDFYRSLAVEYWADDQIAGRLDLSNSIWVDKSLQAKKACVDALSDKYFCYSNEADFYHNNQAANKAVRDFVKEQTHGLIDNDFELAPETLFSLINALYLKDIWNTFGLDLHFTDNEYEFTGKDGEIKSQKFLRGDYLIGRIFEAETFTHFYTETYHRYKIKFLLPKEGYTVDDIFTEENLTAVNGIDDYFAVDDENMVEYETRCLFPEFNASYNKDVKPILQSEFGVEKFFDPNQCDFSTLTDINAYCDKVQHVTELTVDRTGIEGAAVTIEPGVGSAAPQETVYSDFVVNGAFGFILTDPYGVTLFSGVVGEL